MIVESPFNKRQHTARPVPFGLYGGLSRLLALVRVLDHTFCLAMVRRLEQYVCCFEVTRLDEFNSTAFSMLTTFCLWMSAMRGLVLNRFRVGRGQMVLLGVFGLSPPR